MTYLHLNYCKTPIPRNNRKNDSLYADDYKILRYNTLHQKQILYITSKQWLSFEFAFLVINKFLLLSFLFFLNEICYMGSIFTVDCWSSHLSFSFILVTTVCMYEKNLFRLRKQPFLFPGSIARAHF